ncbi:MAG: hypothetical protein IPL01_04465 [Acidobacteria bacterium]|nr:hypothetical protein [Acidobacteriota bacterium]
MVERLRSEIDQKLDQVVTRPKLISVPQIIEPLAPYDEKKIRETARIQASPESGLKLFDNALPEKRQLRPSGP